MNNNEEKITVVNAKQEFLCKTGILDNFIAGWMVEIGSANIGDEDKKIYRLQLGSDTYIFKTIQCHISNEESINRVKTEYTSSLKCSELCMNIAKPINYADYLSNTIRKYVTEIVYEYGDSNILTTTLSPSEILTNMINVSDAMQILHKNGVFHSDLRPATIVLKANEVKIIDLGISIAFDSRMRFIRKRLWNNETVSSSYAYYPPEVIINKDYEANKLDVYCWGMSLYQLITKKTEKELEKEVKLYKYNENEYNKFIEQIKSITIKDEALNELIVEILLLTLNFNYNKRPDFTELSTLIRTKAFDYKVKLKGIRMVL